MQPSRATWEWRRIARGPDVLYDIASVPGRRGNWTEGEFYAHGRNDWEAFRSHWDHYTSARGGVCLEIGCGAGRLTRALARDFERVIGVDVSRDMLERARAVVGDNVELRQTDGLSLPADSDSVDAVFSVHVFQHLETRDDVVRYIREVARIVRAGGTILVHVMLRGAPIGVRESARRRVELLRSRLALRFGRPHLTMRVREYWMNDIYTLLTEAGFEAVELRMIRAGDYGHPCWLATRGS